MHTDLRVLSCQRAMLPVKLQPVLCLSACNAACKSCTSYSSGDACTGYGSCADGYRWDPVNSRCVRKSFDRLLFGYLAFINVPGRLHVRVYVSCTCDRLLFRSCGFLCAACHPACKTCESAVSTAYCDGAGSCRTGYYWNSGTQLCTRKLAHIGSDPHELAIPLSVLMFRGGSNWVV